MLFLDEWRKLWRTPFLRVLTVLLLVGNVALCTYHTRRTEAVRPIPTEVAAQLYKEYATDPAALEAAYESAAAEYEQQQELVAQMRDSMMSTELPPLRSTYADGYSDYMLLHGFLAEQERIDGYAATVRAVADTARRNQQIMLARNETAADTYAYHYQQQVAKRYDVLSERVTLPHAYVAGWDTYFSYTFGDYLLALWVLALAASTVLCEKTSGFYSLLTTTPRGFGRTMWAKIAAALVAVFGGTLLCEGTTLAALALQNGLVGGTHPLQLLSGFTYCPYALAVWQGAAVRIGLKLLTMTAFCMVPLALSAVYRMVIPYTIGGVSIVVNGLLQLLSRSTGWSRLNLFTFANGSVFLARYQAVAVGNAAVPLLWLGCALYAAIIAVSIGGAVGMSCRRWRGGYSRLATRRVSLPRFRRRVPKTLWGAERRKLFSPVVVALAVALTVVRCLSAISGFAVPASYGDEVYQEYTEQWTGALTPAVADEIQTEAATLRAVIEQQPSYYAAYLRGDMSVADYYDTLDAYTYANSRLEHIGRLVSRAEYLQETAERTGITGWILYDTGWERVLFRSFDGLLLSIVVLLLFRAFVCEWRTARGADYPFAVMLRATPLGRRTTWSCKYGWAVVSAAVVWLLFSIIDGVAACSLTLPNADAPLVSMPLYADTRCGITIGQYAVLLMVVRGVGAILLALQVTSLSQLLKKPLLILLSTAALTLLPHLLVTAGLPVFQYADITTLLSGDALWRLSTAAGLCGDGGVMAAMIGGFAAVTAIFTWLSYRQFTGGAA